MCFGCDIVFRMWHVLTENLKKFKKIFIALKNKNYVYQTIRGGNKFHTNLFQSIVCILRNLIDKNVMFRMWQKS